MVQAQILFDYTGQFEAGVHLEGGAAGLQPLSHSPKLKYIYIYIYIYFFKKIFLRLISNILWDLLCSWNQPWKLA